MHALKQAVAFLFRRAAEPELAEDAFVRHASLDLHWLSPKDARRFLEAARSLGYLKEGSLSGRVRPAFEVDEVDVPLDFRIDARALEGAPAAPSSVAEDLVAAAARRRGVGLDAVWADVASRQAEKLLEAPAAAALVAAEAGVDLAPYFARIRDELAKAARLPTPSAS